VMSTFFSAQSDAAAVSDLRAWSDKQLSGGEGGIRTPGRGFSPYNGLANRRLQPLGHLSAGVHAGVFPRGFRSIAQHRTSAESVLAEQSLAGATNRLSSPERGLHIETVNARMSRLTRLTSISVRQDFFPLR
jgi:hypothetical protein